MKIAIVYYSKHHENTKKLIDAIAKTTEVTLIDVTKEYEYDLEPFDLIGFASGIYYQTYSERVVAFAHRNLPKGKKVFWLYTYGVKKDTYTRVMEAIGEEKEAVVVGEFGCPGFDTFGPLKLIGGIAKGRPNEDDVAAAVRFFENLLK